MVPTAATRVFKPAERTLFAALRHVFISLSWEICLESCHPFKLSVVGDPVFEDHRSRSAHHGYRDAAQSIVVKAVVHLTASCRGLPSILGFAAPRGGTCATSPGLNRYRRVLRAKITRIIRFGGFDLLLAVTRGEVSVADIEAEVAGWNEQPAQTPAAATAPPSASNELDQLLAGIESTLPPDVLGPRLLDDKKRRRTNVEAPETLRTAHPGSGGVDGATEPPPELAARAEVPLVSEPDQRQMTRAVKFVFEALKPTVEIRQRKPLRYRIRPTAKLNRYNRDAEFETGRERAINLVVVSLKQLVWRTSGRVFGLLSSSDLARLEGALVDSADRSVRYLYEVRRCITEAVQKGGAEGLRTLTAAGLDEHAKLFELEL